ncbi:MAG: TIGR04150 pseudo-rSAM protein [Firmicutes bacterium]|nr:TIGR04150 pseudo-rSAM protein [Bacillota bacterium]
MKNIKGYWLYFEPYVHIALKKDSVLLYNTVNGERVETKETDLIKLVYTTQHYLNQGVVFLAHDLYKETIVYKFINEIREKFIGDIIDVSLMPEKPVQFIPIPNLLKGTVRTKSTREELSREDIFSYLHFLTLQINNQCDWLCINNLHTYKQIFNCCCHRNKGEIELPFAQIEKISKQIKTFPLKRVYITGGNIFLHSKIEQILRLFDEIKYICSLGFHYLNLPDKNMLQNLNGYKLEIFINPPYEIDKILYTIHLLKKQEMEYLLRFRLVSEYNFEQFNSSFAPILLDGTYITEPLYDNHNLDFFKKYVFLNKSDIFEEPVPLRTVFANSILNSNFFGHIYIDCSGVAKSNPNCINLLGNISTETLYQLIANELLNNYSWKKIRKKSPCNKCLYQYLCPPPSNYEYALKSSNLCHVF